MWALGLSNGNLHQAKGPHSEHWVNANRLIKCPTLKQPLVLTDQLQPGTAPRLPRNGKFHFSPYFLSTPSLWHLTLSSRETVSPLLSCPRFPCGVFDKLLALSLCLGWIFSPPAPLEPSHPIRPPHRRLSHPISWSFGIPTAKGLCHNCQRTQSQLTDYGGSWHLWNVSYINGLCKRTRASS